jgi:hypothetical protein
MRFLALALLLSGCAVPGGGIHADLSKLRPWSTDIESAEPLPPPFVADFEQGARSLSYAALEPTHEKTSPSVALLVQVMDARKYGVVVLEGVPRSLGINSLTLQESADKDGKDGYYHEGETSVAIAKAQEKKVPFVGAEPDEDLIKAAVLAAGFTVQDLFGLYILRLIPQWRRDGTLSNRSFPEAYAVARVGLAKRLAISLAQTPDVKGFQSWFTLKQQQPFVLHDVRDQTTEPVPDSTLFTQKLAAVTDRVRSQHILRVTEEMLNHYGHVLLVFNAIHYPVQEPALESMLGAPTRISDQP